MSMTFGKPGFGGMSSTGTVLGACQAGSRDRYVVRLMSSPSSRPPRVLGEQIVGHGGRPVGDRVKGGWFRHVLDEPVVLYV